MLTALILVRNYLMKLLEWAVILLMAALVIDVLWGVISRSSGAFVAWLGRRGIEAWLFLPRGQGKWTEELAIYLLIWVSLLGASVAYASKAHLGVDYLVGKLATQAARLAEILVNLLVAFFVCAAFIWGGFVLVRETLLANQLSPTLGIKVGYVYLALPISGMFMLIFAVESIIEIISGKKPALQTGQQEN
jgi:TRAP-type C4-dicarboxylate transport system permease small subunit